MGNLDGMSAGLPVFAEKESPAFLTLDEFRSDIFD
jgi:hypothetical protein